MRYFTFFVFFALLLASSNTLSSQVKITSSLPDEVFPCDTFYFDITITNNSIEILNDLEFELRGVDLASPLPTGVEVLNRGIHEFSLSLPSLSSCDSMVLSIPLFADCDNDHDQLDIYSQSSSGGVFLYAEQFQVGILPFSLQIDFIENYEFAEDVTWFTHDLELTNNGFGSISEIWIRPSTLGNIYKFDSILNHNFTYDGDLIKLTGQSFANVGNGDHLLDKGERILLNLKWLILSCGEDEVSFDIMIPCDGEFCFEGQVNSQTQSFQLFKPKPVYIQENQGYGLNHIDTVLVTVYNDANTLNTAGNTMYDVKVDIKSLGNMHQEDSIYIYSAVIGDQKYQVELLNDDNTNPVYSLDLDGVANVDPDGTRGLQDLDGDGFYDDLAPGDSLKIECIHQIFLNHKVENSPFCNSTLQNSFRPFQPVIHYNDYCSRGTFPQAIKKDLTRMSGIFSIGAKLFDYIFDPENSKVEILIRNPTSILPHCESALINLMIHDIPLEYLSIDTFFLSRFDTSWQVKAEGDSTLIRLNITDFLPSDTWLTFYPEKNCDSIFYEFEDPNLPVCESCFHEKYNKFKLELNAICDPSLEFELACKEYDLPLNCDSVNSEPLNLFRFTSANLYRLSVGWKDSTMSTKVDPFNSNIADNTAFVNDTLLVETQAVYHCGAIADTFFAGVMSDEEYQIIEQDFSYYDGDQAIWYNFNSDDFQEIIGGGYTTYQIHSSEIENKIGKNIALREGDSIKISYMVVINNLKPNQNDNELNRELPKSFLDVTTDNCNSRLYSEAISLRVEDQEIFDPQKVFYNIGGSQRSGVQGIPILACEPIFCGAILGFPSYSSEIKNPDYPVELINEWRPIFRYNELSFTFKDIASYEQGSFGVYKLTGAKVDRYTDLKLVKKLDENDLTFSTSNNLTKIEVTEFPVEHDSSFRKSFYFIGFTIRNECMSSNEFLELQGDLSRSHYDGKEQIWKQNDLSISYDYFIHGISFTDRPNKKHINLRNRRTHFLKYAVDLQFVSWSSSLSDFKYNIEVNKSAYAFVDTINFSSGLFKDTVFHSTSPNRNILSRQLKDNTYYVFDSVSILLYPYKCGKDTLILDFISRCHEKGMKPDFCDEAIIQDTFIINNFYPVISASIPDTSTNKITLCRPFTKTFSFRNTGFGTLYEGELLLTLPEFVTLNELRYKWGNNGGSIPLNNSYIVGDTLHIPLDGTQVDTLPGIQFGDFNTFLFEADFIVECSDQTSFSISGILKGEAPCGDTNFSNSAIFKPIFVKENNQTGEFNMDLTSKFQYNCTDTAELIVTVKSPENRSGKEFVDIEFPLGFKYVPNSTGELQNFIAQEPVSSISRDGYNLRWKLSTKNPGDTSIQFKFKIINFCNSGCNSPSITMAIGDSIPSPCNPACNAIVSLGEEVFDPFYFKPAIKTIEISAKSVFSSLDSIKNTLNIEIDWLSEAFDSTLLRFKLVEDVNGDKIYNGPDRVIGEYSRLWTLQNGLESIIFNSSNDYSCGFLLVLDRAENPCICTQHQIHFTVNPLREELVCPDEEIIVDVGNGCTFTIERGGQHINLQNDTLFYVGNQNSLADTVLISKSCGSGCERLDTLIFYSEKGLLELNLEQGILCAGDSTGIISVTTMGVAEDSLNISWNHDPAIIDFTIENLPAGKYIPTVKWQNCQWVDTIILSDPDTMSGSVDIKKSGCDSLSPYIAWVTPEGGIPPYEIYLDGNKVSDSVEVGVGKHEIMIIDSAGCEFTDQFTIVDSSGQYVVESLSATCRGDNDGAIIIDGPPIQYIVLNDSIQFFEPTIDNLPAGLYDIVVYDEYKCPHYFQTAISYEHEIDLNLGDTITAIFNEEVELLPTVNPVSEYSYNWRPPELFECIDCPNNSLTTGKEPITVYLTVKDTAGCIAHDTVHILINSNINIYIPNTFTPNNDGVNDYFELAGTGFQYKRLLIFDRWGSQLFESRNKSHKWDGTYKSEKVPAGVYVYIFEYINTEGTTEYLTGSIMVAK